MSITIGSNWENIPKASLTDFTDAKAPIKFYAETTQFEKINRIFNASMFGIVGVKILASFFPGTAKLAFSAIAGASILQGATALAILTIGIKVIATLALILVIRKIINVVVTHAVYPAAVISYFNKYDNERGELFKDLTAKGNACTRIALNKSGIAYDAFAIENPATKGNSKWVIMAGGNCWIGETAIPYFDPFQKLGFNILFVNGPGVARSTGFPTSYSIGAGQEAGLQFLEKVVEAKKILLYGTSLGGGGQAEAILSHKEFRTDIKYAAWTDRSFDKLSNAAKALVPWMAQPILNRLLYPRGPAVLRLAKRGLYIASNALITGIVKPLFFLLGIELNTVAGAKKLQKLGIKHIITQNNHGHKNHILPLNGPINEKGTDGVIANWASTYVGIRKAEINDSPRSECYGHEDVDHNYRLGRDIEIMVEDSLNKYFA